MTNTSRQLQVGMREAALAINPRVTATLAFNRETNLLVGSRCCVEFGNRVQHRAYGKRWANIPSHLRLRFYAFPEHILSNFHYHLLLNGSPEICEAAIMYGDEIWHDLTKTGHAYVAWIENQNAMARYCVKAVKQQNAFENVVVYGPQ